MWPHAITAIIGVWLMSAPAVLNFSGSGADHDHIIGPIVASFGIIAISQTTRGVRWLSVVTGFWLIASPLIINAPPRGAKNDVYCGALIVFVSVFRGRIKQKQGGGWLELFQNAPEQSMQPEPPNPTKSTGAVVAIAHTNEKHRSIERVTGLVETALLELGGIAQFVPPGSTVLLKPNQTVYYSAEEGCTTDPVVIGALIRLCKKAGAARVQVAESSGGFFSSKDCMRITGMAAMAEREGAELIDLGSDDVPNRKVPIPNGKTMSEVPLPAPLLDADVIIDVPKAKNHHIEPISGALKNWVGSVNQNWRNFNHGDTEMFDRFIDIMSVTKPRLCVVDALICGEGDGPIANLPHWAGCILASTDPVATDVAIARLLKRDWTKLEFARKAEARGLGVREPIEFRGAPIEKVAIDAWHGHHGYNYLPVNFIVGKHVTLEGTIGHVKSVLDSMLARGELAKVLALRGTPTIMVGAADDPNFEEHLKEGPYIVFDDSAKPEYKTDPRVYFVPGHPVLRTAMPELMKGLGLKLPGRVKMKWEQVERQALHGYSLGSPARKAIAMGGPILAGAALVTAIFAGVYMAGRGRSESSTKS